MKRAERELIMRQGIVLPETPHDRRQQEGLEEDLLSGPHAGRPLRLRLRNFHAGADGYLAALGGPLPYMQRLRDIEKLTESSGAELAEALARSQRCARRVTSSVAAGTLRHRMRRSWR